MECSDPKLLRDLPINPRSQLPLLHRRQCAPRLTKLTLGQALGQQQLQPLLHFPSRLIRKGDGQDLAWIGSVLSNEVGDAMGESTRLPTPCTSHHQQRPLVVIHRPALGVVEAGQKAHAQNVRAKKQEAIRTRGLCVVKKNRLFMLTTYNASPKP